MTVLEMPVIQKTEAHLRLLVRQHRQLKDEPLQLAVHFVPVKPSRNIFLLEIADRFGIDSVDPTRTMFEVSYGWPPGEPMSGDQELRLVLTNPNEWKVAVRENWSAVKTLRQALKKNRATVLFATPRGTKLWRLLRV